VKDLPGIGLNGLEIVPAKAVDAEAAMRARDWKRILNSSERVDKV